MARYVVQDYGSREDFDASDDAAALEHGEQWLRTGDWDRTKTLWLEAAVFRMDDHGGDTPPRRAGVFRSITRLVFPVRIAWRAEGKPRRGRTWRWGAHH
jgi:hypothetical protein